ncbi:hypothetical protein WJX74_006057 [Apatococcus lobatus]|uniref:Uncharacterized protein n=1 Tax=Apatococcus lobatus TaxID=904363 RepID=A0AAW1Q5N2_9CHLO
MFKEVAAGSILEDCLDYGRLTNCRLNSCEAAAPGIVCTLNAPSRHCLSLSLHDTKQQLSLTCGDPWRS